MALVDYEESDEEGGEEEKGREEEGGGGEANNQNPTRVLARSVDIAPLVVGVAEYEKGSWRDGEARRFAGESTVMVRNLPAAAVLAPKQGPSHPYRREVAAGGFSGGTAERAVVEEWSFHEQYHTYQSFGYAMDASGGDRLVGTAEGLSRAESAGGETISSSRFKGPRRRPRRGKNDDVDDDEEEEDVGEEESHGVWAPEPSEEPTMSAERKAELAEALESERSKRKRGYDQNEDFDRRDERKIAHLLPARHTRDTRAIEATSTFHGERERDYRGRSWFEPPPGMSSKIDDGHDCFLPKTKVHTYTGHSKGVQCIRVFPKTGHLLLSASLDGTCKIWDVYAEKALKRTYSGHSEAVRDANLAPDGSKFASCGFDRFVRIWDTETGACLHTMSPNRKMCYCVDFYPRDDNVFLAGASDNRVYQWDLRAPANHDTTRADDDSDDGRDHIGAGPQIVQEYNYHLQPVNTITYVDDDRKFVTTADDKKIFVWEHNIPVPTKYISEPHMHAIPVVELHPNRTSFCGQSLDNSVVTYTATEKVRHLPKKKFKGHLCSGYACGLTFSPNGRYLASGDAEGRLFLWDFKSTRLIRKWHCHDSGPCIGVAWHPIEPSMILTCGWDGLIKVWT